MVRLVKQWNSLPRKRVEPPSVHAGGGQRFVYCLEMPFLSFWRADL